MADAEGTFQGEPTYSAHAHNERALFRGTGLGLTDKNSHDTWAQAFLNGHLPIARAARTWLAASYL